MLTHRQQNFYEWRHMMVAREALAMGGTYKIGQKGGKMIPSEGGKLGFWSWTNFLPRNWGDKKCLKSYPNFTDSSIFITNNPVLCHTYTLIFMTRIQHVCITCQFNSIPSKFFPEENMKLNRINIFLYAGKIFENRITGRDDTQRETNRTTTGLIFLPVRWNACALI